MNYDRYYVFYVVGKCRSFTQAAKELYTSQPSITRTIKTLEEELGCRLFSRSKKGVELTVEGKTLYRYAEAAFEQIAKGEEEISASLSSQSGTIAVATTVTALGECLYLFIEEFHRLYPKVRFRISTQSSDESVAKLRSGSADFAFVSTPYRRFEGLIETPVAQFENILIAGTAFKELQNKKHTLAELADYPFISLGPNMQLREYANELFKQEGVSIVPAIELDSASTIVPMAIRNFGLSILPKSFAQPALEQKTIFEVPLVHPLGPRSIVMVTNPNYPSSSVSKRFESMVLELSSVSIKSA